MRYRRSINASDAEQNRIMARTVIPVREGHTPEDAKDPKAPVEPTSEQDDVEEGQVNPDDPVGNKDSEDSNYLPVSEDDVSLGVEDFILPEEPLEQECFKRQLIATVRSLKRSSNSSKQNRIHSTTGGPRSWLPKSMAFND